MEFCKRCDLGIKEWECIKCEEVYLNSEWGRKCKCGVRLANTWKCPQCKQKNKRGKYTMDEPVPLKTNEI